MSQSLKITFLGTGTSSGVPMIGCNCAVCKSVNQKDKRFRSSILVQSATTTLTVDAGPDFRNQMLRENVQKLDAILFTHPHKDHIAGLDDVRAFNYFTKMPVNVYANAITKQALEREFYYAFEEAKYPGIPQINIHPVGNETFWVGDIAVTPFLVWHLNMPVIAYRFGSFTYITDANRIEPDEMQKIKGSKTIVLNALRKEKHISHFTLSEAISLVNHLEVPTAYFTHISHQLGMHVEIEKELPMGMHLAYDGLTIDT